MEYCESYPNKGGVPLLGFGKTRSMPQDMFRIGLGKVCAAVALKALFTRSLMALSVCFPGCELISPLFEYLNTANWARHRRSLLLVYFPKSKGSPCSLSTTSVVERISSCWCFCPWTRRVNKRRDYELSCMSLSVFCSTPPLPLPLQKTFYTLQRVSQHGRWLVIMDYFLSLNITTVWCKLTYFVHFEIYHTGCEGERIPF